MQMEEVEYLAHYGILRRSGRYPWGSGGNNEYVTEGNRSFLDFVKDLLRRGFSQKEVAEGFGMSVKELRAAKTLAIAEKKAADIAQVEAMKAKGMANTAISERLGIPESTVRSYLKPGAKLRKDSIETAVDILKSQVDEHGFIDVGKGAEFSLNISPERLEVALQILAADGYNIHTNLKRATVGAGKDTTYKVLTLPENDWSTTAKNLDNVKLINEHLKDTGKGSLGIKDPLSIDQSRLAVNYDEDGGTAADGTMYIRPGVNDLDMGGKNYAQVRIQVGDGHYLKGMAIYKDDLPDGVDIVFNTNKSDTGNKLDALKELETDSAGNVDRDNPFGAQIRRQILNDNEEVTSAVNIISEEGNWNEWSDTLSTQILSKQKPTLAKEQLDLRYESFKNRFDEAKALTNPTLKKQMLEDLANELDHSSYHLEAASRPRQKHQVLIPIPGMKDTEVYAPNYEQGESVILIRHPHAGTFEIPRVTVNNRVKKARDLLGNAEDAIGINSKIAEQLSGADFDGDTVLVIPDSRGSFKNDPTLEGLKNFNAREEYRGYEGMRVMPKGSIGSEMGQISNLITDMTIQKASKEEMARAVRHSMVVIDAHKHKLNYKLSEERNAIRALKEKYQTGGSSTLISRAKSPMYVPERKPRTMAKGGPIDKRTGEKVYEETERLGRTGKPRTTKTFKLAEERDARRLSSGTPIENLYADHSNRLKSMANEARLEYTKTPNLKSNPSAKRTYSAERERLMAAKRDVDRKAPLERRAQNLARATVKAKREADPTMDKDREKKVKAQALAEARNRVGVTKTRIDITPREWEAIQAGAISNDALRTILRTADPDQVKEYARPKTTRLMTSQKIQSARSRLSLGYTRAEVAAFLGVSVSTLDEALK